MKRVLLIGILASLFAGVLVATATSSVTPKKDDRPMTVPSSRIGDAARYAWFAKYTPEERKEFGAAAAGRSADGDWVQGGGEAFSIEGLGTSADRDGRIHDALMVRTVQDQMTGGSNVETSSDNVQYLEMEHGSLIRSDSELKMSSGFGTSQYASAIFYAPSASPFFAHQGRTFRLGDQLDPATDAGNECGGVSTNAGAGSSNDLAGLGYQDMGFHVSVHDCDRMGAPDDQGRVVSDRFWVADRGVVDGHDAYDLRREVVFDFDHFELPGGDQPLGAAHVTSTRDEWVSAEVPYVLVEQTSASYEADGRSGPLGGWMRALEDYRAGSTPVAWREGALAAAPVPERSSGTATVPADGTGAQLPYPLSQALADVATSAAATQFRVWEMSHPDAHLVSAEETIGENSRSQAPTSMWHLLYAEPSGSGHELSLERPPSGGQAIVQDHGDRDALPYDPKDLHTDLVTFAQVAALWLPSAPADLADPRPNYAHWGMDLSFGSGLTCLGSGSHTFDHDDVALELRTVYVGFMNVGSCQETQSTMRAEVLAYDAGEARLLTFLGDAHHFTSPGLLASGPSDAAPVVAKNSASVHAVVSPPDIRTAAVASTSLLAAFLVVYFLPAIKFAGAQALWFVPGYAKLHKADILDNRIRDALVAAIKADPGLSITDLSKRVEAGWGTLVYHLRVLEDNELVSSVQDGRHRRIFPVGLVDHSAQGQLALLRNERVRQLYELIQEEPGAIQEHLARRIGISAPATYWHLKRLEGAGLVGRVRKGRNVQYFPNPKPETHSSEGMEVA